MDNTNYLNETGYTLLTTAQIEQIETCASHRIDMADLRKQVRAVWPQATAIELRANVEYDDGSSYSWRLDEIAIFEKDAEISTPTPGAALSYESALKDIRRSISFGGPADPEDDCSDTIRLELDTPALNELYQRT